MATIALIDACLPDYFQGGGIVFAVSVTGSDRVWQVREALIEEVRSWDGYVESRDLSDTEWDAVEHAVRAVFRGVHPLRTAFPGMPVESEYPDGDTPYAYFELEF